MSQGSEVTRNSGVFCVKYIRLQRNIRRVFSCITIFNMFRLVYIVDAAVALLQDCQEGWSLVGKCMGKHWKLIKQNFSA